MSECLLKLVIYKFLIRVQDKVTVLKPQEYIGCLFLDPTLFYDITFSLNLQLIRHLELLFLGMSLTLT